MALTKKSNIYSKCEFIESTKPKYEVDQKLYEEIATDYKLLPTFENTVFNKVYTKHYSLQRNQLLKCRWTQYKRNIESRIFAPFNFPDIRDLHFYNCAIRIKPEESIHMMEHRMQMTPGPGVDARGHLPIPQESMMKRGKADRANDKKAKKSAQDQQQK